MPCGLIVSHITLFIFVDYLLRSLLFYPHTFVNPKHYLLAYSSNASNNANNAANSTSLGAHINRLLAHHSTQPRVPQKNWSTETCSYLTQVLVMSSNFDTWSMHLQTLFLHIEKLKSDNWNDWKLVITSLLEMNGLDLYIQAGAIAPMAVIPARPSEKETKTISKWETEDKLCFRLIKITISLEEWVHMTGTMTSAVLWKSLYDVKELKGLLGTLATWWWLFRLVVGEGTHDWVYYYI